MRRLVGLALVAVTVALAVVVFGGGSSTQTVRVQLRTAGGLREGSDVKVAGVAVGKIADLRLDRDHGDEVLAELTVDRGKAQVGPDARVQIVTRNLLGSKFVSIEPGNPRGAPGTVTVPASRVAYPVDVDEVLDTLDADTRTRLQIMLNELGYALTGRKADFSAAMRLLPQDLDAGARLLSEVAADNRTLRGVVEHTGSAVRRIARERGQLGRFVDVAGTALDATTKRRTQLAASLDRAPATLRSAQSFLGDLEATTRPLTPAARTIAAVAPVLATTLAQLAPFERAARPTLARARAIAPDLTRLGTEATPVLRRAQPTLASLTELSRTLAPLSRALDVSIDDVLGLIEGWARAIQTRDGFSHIFRGRATAGPEFFRSLIQSSGGPDTSARRRRAAKQPSAPVERLPKAEDLADGLKQKLPKLQVPKLPPVDVQNVVPDVLNGLGLEQDGGGSRPIAPLLDFLLGR